MNRRGLLITISGGLIAALVAIGVLHLPTSDSGVETDAVTFNKDIAPLVFENCASCHRAGETAPFPLLNYQDVSKRADQIVEVTQSRFMPPWLPKPGHGKFSGERYLDDAQIALLKVWWEQGMIEGDSADLPPPPQFVEGWRNGEPDLIVEMPRPYTLQAGGTDVFRNFVIPLPVESSRFVRAVELQPGNKAVIHHANMLVDQTGEARRLDEQEADPGFAGMENLAVAQRPSGHFLSWKVGTPSFFGYKNKAWRLDAGTDLVVNMHMLPSGKPEPIQASVGIYFAEDMPTPPRLALLQLERDSHLDIPPGDAHFVVTDTFELPVDVDVLAVYPHAHLLGKDLQGYAILPDGSKEWLIWIDQWDWNWQAVYRYETPISLPRGTVLTMRYTYDNSTANVLNPYQPPRRVMAGNRTEDEMAHLWVQMLPKNELDLSRLNEAKARHQLRKYPNKIQQRVSLGLALVGQGKNAEALFEFQRVIRIQPDHADACYNAGCVQRLLGQLDEARVLFERTLRIKPQHAEAHNNLAIVFHGQKQFERAITHYEKALELRPHFALTHNNLGLALQKLDRVEEAVAHFQEALRLQPDYAAAHRNLQAAQAQRQPAGSENSP